jgi:hypothetical protein
VRVQADPVVPAEQQDVEVVDAVVGVQVGQEDPPQAPQRPATFEGREARPPVLLADTLTAVDQVDLPGDDDGRPDSLTVAVPDGPPGGAEQHEPRAMCDFVHERECVKYIDERA